MAMLLVGDVLERLGGLADGSVQCCVTSPPYWGLRDYGTATWVGGDAECDHSRKCSSVPHGSTLASAPNNSNHEREGWKGGTCGKCGAVRIDAQLGLESTPDEYVARMVEVFRSVRRVLRKDGTLWLNIGDSYTSGGRETFGTFKPDTKQATHPAIKSAKRAPQPDGLKPKDLVGIPWLLAFALRADGWYLRSDIIWSKPNPMPESVTDRPTKAHEYLFLLTKAAKYFYDADAVREPSEDKNGTDRFKGRCGVGDRAANQGWNGGEVVLDKHRNYNPLGRNRRTVWTIAPRPFKGAHFATFPPALIEPCILAGSKPRDTILDPFIGSGTTACVALQHDRDCIGIDLSRKYIIDIAVPRIIKETGTEPLVVG